MNLIARLLTFGLLCSMLLAGCVSQPPAPAPPPSSTPILSTATARIPTQTALPTASPSPQPYIEPVTVQPCVRDGTGEKQTFREIITSFGPAINAIDSYRYRTVYRYLEDNHYADDDFSVEVVGVHNGRRTAFAEGSFSFGPSQLYERSKVVLTDLRTGLRSETILIRDRFWVREAGEPSWVAFDPGVPGELLNPADLFSPPWILYMVFGPVLSPVDRAEEPDMRRGEVLGGREVTHRCWIMPVQENYAINVFSINNDSSMQHESLYTFFGNTELHLWTTPDDKQLVRLALTGVHTGERLGLNDYELLDEYVEHNSPRDFLLWMEISDIGTQFDIEPPPSDQISLTIPGKAEPTTAISTPYNDLPLPTHAERIADLVDPASFPASPREFPRHYSLALDVDILNAYLRAGWHQIPADRRPKYQVEMELPEAADFYLKEMSRRGWLLKDKLFHSGRPVLYLFFERNGILLPVILEKKEGGLTNISAVLPPPDDVIEAILSGWKTYTNQNSGLTEGDVQAIAFDAQGKAWVGTSKGLSVFDGNGWTAKIIGPDVRTLAVDPQGQIWVVTRNGLFVFDGKETRIYNSENSILPVRGITAFATDKSGRIWLSWYENIFEFGFGVSDGMTYKNYSLEDLILPLGDKIVTIVSDPKGQIWIGTEGAGVYMFDGKAWKTVLKTYSLIDEIHDLAIGTDGAEVYNFDGKAWWKVQKTYSPIDEIHDLAIDQQGRVWIGTRNGLRVYNGEDWITFTPGNSALPFESVDALAIDEYNRVWVGGDYGAVAVLETDGTWNTYTSIHGAASGDTNSLVVDPQGRIWVGTDEGLNVFTPPAPASMVARVLPDPTPLPPKPTPMPTPGPGWSTYTTENSGLLNNEVHAVAIDGQDRVWVGTQGGASVLSPSGEWTSYTVANSALITNDINTLLIDTHNRVWMGTGSGAAVLGSDGAMKMYTKEDFGLTYFHVGAIKEDSQGRVWLADPLKVLGPDGKWISFNTPDPDTSPYYRGIENIALDKQGRVWAFIQDYGVSVLSPNGVWVNHPKEDLGMKGWDMTATDVDEQGKVWIASRGDGIVVLAPDGSRTNYTAANSDLPSDNVTALTIDRRGRVWVGTEDGLSVLTPDGRWTSYTYKYNNSILINRWIWSLAVDSQGRVWMGTNEGLAVFIPDEP